MKRWGARQGALPGLNNLLAFEASVRLGSFRAAADEMHLTQGAIAQQVRALEAELHCSLFQRHARGLDPTPAALEYFNRVRLALGVIEEATRELVGTQHMDPRLTLSTTPTLASRWLIPRLPHLSEANADMALVIDASNAVRPLKGAGSVDLAIRWARPPFADAHSQYLLPGRLVPVCGPALAARYRLPDAAQLAQAPLLADGYNSWDRWFETFGEGKRPEAGGTTFTQTSLAIDAAEQGMGVALAPRLLVQDALSRGSLVLAARVGCELDVGAAFYLLTASPPSRESPLGKLVDWLIAEAADAPKPA